MMWGRDELGEAAKEEGFAQRYRAVVVAGGDGTLHRALNTPGVVESGAAIAHFPLGTENLFAKQFGHTRDVESMARLIAGGRTAALDLCTASYPDGRVTRFSIVASAGFDAEVIHRLEVWRHNAKGGRLRRVWRASYVRPILAAVAGYGYPAVEVEADGKKMRGVLAMVFNLPRYGMGLGICPDARGDDGLLDYAVFERPGAPALVSCAISIKLGRHRERSDVQSGRARNIRIRGELGQLPMEMDGEGARFTPVEIGVEPGRLRVLVA